MRESFLIELSDVALADYNCAPLGSDYQEFSENLFAEYRSVQDSSDYRLWIRERLSKEFFWISGPPTWHFPASWPFCFGRPAIFINQYSVPPKEILSGRLVPDCAVFLFGYRVPSPPSFGIEHVIITQYPDLTSASTTIRWNETY